MAESSDNVFEIHDSEEAEGQRFWVKEIAPNGEQVSTSEMLSSYKDAVTNARSQGGPDATIINKVNDV